MAGANPLRGESQLVAGDETFTLTYDINAICAAEEASGLDADTLLVKLEAGRSTPLLRAMVWAGLQRHHACNLLRAGEIVQLAGAKVARAAMIQAIARAFPVAEPDAPANPPPAADGTGSAGWRAGRLKGSTPTPSGGRRRAHSSP